MERFWSKVNRDGPTMSHMDTACWVWTAGNNGKGYGWFWLNGRPELAHRVSYSLEVGSIEAYLDHRCLNRLCVNPGHLREVDDKQNNENRAGAQKNSRSGVRGVFWDGESGRWRVQIGHNGRLVHAGYFDSLEEASVAATAKRLELFTHNELDRLA